MPQAELDIPPNILMPLRASGLEMSVIDNIPYSNGIIMILLGKAENDGNVITQNLEMAMKNTGFTIDDITRYLFSMEDNLRAVMGANPAITEPIKDFYRTVYFTLFIEYLKSFSFSDKYRSPNELLALAASRGVNREMFEQAVNMKIFNNNMYALSLKNPPNVQPQISPWIFVYNNGGSARLFLTEDEMVQYDKKFGKGFTKSLKKMFDKDHIHLTGVALLSIAGIGVAAGIFLKKRSDKSKEKEKEVLSQLESEVEE